MSHPEYSVHPSVAYGQAVIANLAETTGEPKEVWLRRIAEAGPADAKVIVRWLRAEHAMGGTTANLLARLATEGPASIEAEAYLAAAPGLVDSLYSGPKAALRPLHDRIVAAFSELGDDVRFAPTRTLLPVYRHHVIAHIRPATRTRIDVGLALPAGATGDRLVDTGGAGRGDRITHRIGVSDAREVDGDFLHWIGRAHEHDGT